jgi:hypothetical protein
MMIYLSKLLGVHLSLYTFWIRGQLRVNAGQARMDFLKQWFWVGRACAPAGDAHPAIFATGTFFNEGNNSLIYQRATFKSNMTLSIKRYFSFW